MSLKLIHGPPNSGRAGVIRQRLVAALEREPVLVVPTIDDVYSFEQELCAGGAVLGAEVMTFGGLFRAVATAAGAPPGAELTPSQRLGAVSAAIIECHEALGPLGRSASRPGFASAFERLLDELQASGLEPAEVEASAATLESSAYLGDIATIFATYAAVRDRLGRLDLHGIAREAIQHLRRDGASWRKRPVFLYGLDDLTPNQLSLIAALTAVTEVTVALPYEEGNTALAARASLLEALRKLGAAETETEPDAANTDSPLLFHLEREFGAPQPEQRRVDSSLVLLRSAGSRGEAETVATEIARLLAGGTDPEQIAIVLRDPARRGPLLASVLESYGVPMALEAKIRVDATSIGFGLIALLEATVGEGRAADLLRYLRATSGLPSGQLDWFERAVRRRRIQKSTDALTLWEEGFGDLPTDIERIRKTAARPADLAMAVGQIARSIGARTLPRRQSESTELWTELERLAAAAISNALSERSELPEMAPAPGSLARALAEIEVRAWSGPAEGRVRIADPYRMRAARFDYVFVASLQDGEFPQHEGHADPFLTEAQRESLRLPPRRDVEAEERYLFHACLALPRKRLFLSWRDSDENGAAEAPSPLLNDLHRLLDPPPGTGDDSAHSPRAEPVRGRDLAQVVARVAEAPSETELARSIAARGTDGEHRSLIAAAGVTGPAAERVASRLASAHETEGASRAPGPLSNPHVNGALAAVPAYGGTTLEIFDVCSYRWFVAHELDPQPLDPRPDQLIQGGLMHEALDRLFRERPQGDALPRPDSLGAWKARGTELVCEVAAERKLGGHPAERAIVRRVEGLLSRFLGEEAARPANGFEPWLTEARFGEDEECERPTLTIDGWGLHGAIDRIDRAANDRALVLDYKLSGRVTAREKLEQEAKLQLQLYMIAVAEHWGVDPVGGLYHPLRGTSERRPRGVVLDEVADQLSPYGLSRTDIVDREEFELLLADARQRAGEIVGRMRRGEITRDPGPRPGLRGHGVCPVYCDFAPICRRDRAPVEARREDEEEG